MKRPNTGWVPAFIIFCLALGIRLVYLFQIKSNFPGWDTPTIDPLYHDLWAKQIASGNILGAGPFFRAPFYAYFLGLIYAIAGPSFTVSKILQHIIGAISCALIFLFADRFFDRRTAVLSGIVSAFYWVFIYFEDELLLDSLLVFFSIILVWSLIRAAEKPTLKRFFASGLILGLAAITRPNYLAVIPLLFFWTTITYRKDLRTAVARFLVFLAGSLLLILPVTARNIIVGHDIVLISSQGGINFYIGNNPYADGTSAIMPQFGPTWQYADCEYLAKIETGKIGREMKQSEVSSFYYKKALDFIIHDPARWAGLMFRKFVVFWNRYEISNNQNLYFFRRFASITAILPPLFFIVSPLSLIGLWIIFRRERKYHLIGYFVIVYMLTVILFFVNSRFRLPVMPFLIILASWALFVVYERVRASGFKASLVYLFAILAFAAFSDIDFFGISRGSFAMSHFSLGNVYMKKGLNDKALDEYAVALRTAGCVPSAHLNRGIIFFQRLEFEKARREFDLEIEKCGRSSNAHNNLSVLDRLEGNAEAALHEARTAISEAPQHLEAYVNEILALRILGADSEAYSVADSLTSIFPDFLPGHYFKGKMELDAGNTASAEKEFLFVVSRGAADILENYDLSTIYSSQIPYGYKPDKMPGLAYYELGLIEVSRGNIDSALICFEHTARVLPDYPDGWTNLALAYDHKKMYQQALAAFKRSIDLDPDNPVTLYDLGLTLGKTGMLPEAADAFRKAIELRPEFPEAREKLLIVQSLLDSASKQ